MNDPTSLPELPFLTQREAAQLLRVSVSYLRSSDCPKVLLPGRGKRPIVRYLRDDVVAWASHWGAARYGISTQWATDVLVCRSHADRQTPAIDGDPQPRARGSH